MGRRLDLIRGPAPLGIAVTGILRHLAAGLLLAAIVATAAADWLQGRP